LANSVDAALDYYEFFGMEWERQMLIRLRFVAGPEALAQRFAGAITPFVYRRHIDPGVARAVRAMKARIEDERRRAGRDIEADLKEGPGGIRDVEFLVQAFQLFHGGRFEALRGGSVAEVLAVLGRLELLPAAAVIDLSQAYTWLRRAEHALQMVEERQTQRFPRERFGQIALARRMGYLEPEGERARERLLGDWTTLRSRVRAQFEALVLGEGDDAAA
jgi:glutamate-ammonia-ligase adenylyltransferase